jgi:hypothetical protein
MYVRKRIRKRSFVRKHWLLSLCALGLVSFLGAFFVAQYLRGLDESTVFETRNPDASVALNKQLILKTNERYVYPYSVIPGGVQSPAELTDAMVGDPVVAEHYAGFAMNQTRIIHASETQYMHVAYRVQDKVYWTAKKIRIPKGEALITDGKETARTRCGNRVSAVSMDPVSDQEPTIDKFEVPQIAELIPPAILDMNRVPNMAGSVSGQLNVPKIPTTPPVKPVPSRQLIHYRPIFLMRPNDVVVPEPATISLLGVGLAALLAVRFTRKK